MLSMLEVALQLLVPNAPAPFRELRAEDKQQTQLSVSPAIVSGLPRPVGFAPYWGLPSSLA